MMNDVERLAHAETLLNLSADNRTAYVADQGIVDTDLDIISQLIIDLGTQQNEDQTNAPTEEDSPVCESTESKGEEESAEEPVEVAEATEEA